MSSLASSSRLLVPWSKLSPLSGCRGGSMEVLGHTSLRSTSVRSRTLLWRQMVYPPLWQHRAWSTDIDSPQAQWVGRLLTCQPYLKHRASLKSPLCSRKSNSSRGMEVTQLDAPFSSAHSKSLCWLLESCCFGGIPLLEPVLGVYAVVCSRGWTLLRSLLSSCT